MRHSVDIISSSVRSGRHYRLNHLTAEETANPSSARLYPTCELSNGDWRSKVIKRRALSLQNRSLPRTRSPCEPDSQHGVPSICFAQSSRKKLHSAGSVWTFVFSHLLFKLDLIVNHCICFHLKTTMSRVLVLHEEESVICLTAEGICSGYYRQSENKM